MHSSSGRQKGEWRMYTLPTQLRSRTPCPPVSNAADIAREGVTPIRPGFNVGLRAGATSASAAELMEGRKMRPIEFMRLSSYIARPVPCAPGSHPLTHVAGRRILPTLSTPQGFTRPPRPPQQTIRCPHRRPGPPTWAVRNNGRVVRLSAVWYDERPC